MKPRAWLLCGVACALPALAFAQEPQSAQARRRAPEAVSPATKIAQDIVVPQPVPVTQDNYGPSDAAPAPNDRIPVRRDFQPELRKSPQQL